MIFTSMLYTLLSTAATLRRDMSILYSRVAVTTLLKCFHVSLLILFLYVSLSKGIGLYGGLYHTTSLIHIFHIFIFLVSAVILQLTAFYPSKVWFKEYASLFYLILKFFYYSFLHNYTQILNKMGQQFKIIEYPLIILFIIIGAMFLVSTSDIVSLFLSIELQSYGLYLLSTLYRDSELSTSAGLTYFLLGGLSSCFILLGTSLLYANSATTTLDGVYVITSLSFISNKDINNVFYWYKPSYINTSLLIMSVGFLFKVSAAPFQFWSPDVYDAIPTIVTTFVAIIAKISIFVFLLELVHYTSNSLSSDEFSWTDSLLISSLLSLIIGTVLGLTQFRIKRLFAYSTISHVGFILLALSINSLESIQAFIFYLMQYTISNLNAFLLLISIGFSKYPSIIFDYFSKHKQTNNLLLLEKNNSPIQLLTQLKGYFFLNPILALSLAITVFSLVGIPPLIGFFAKQMVLSAALDSGYVFLTLIAILTSVVSAVYYLGIIKQIFFDLPEYSLDSLFKEYQSHDNSLEDKLAFKPEDHSIDLLSKYRLPKLSYYHDEEKQENEEKKENTTPFVDQIGKYRIDRDKHIKSILKRALYEYKKQKQEQEQEQEKIENLNLNTNKNNNPICLVRRPKYIDIYLFVVKMEKIEQELKKIEQELVKIKQELVKIKNLNENLNKNKNNPTYLYILYNMFLSSSLTITVSSFTLILLLFIFTPREWLNLANLLAIITLNS